MKSKKKKMLKEGISLIVLVITIIVMIILATAIILSLNNTNVIQKANEAVEGTNLKNVEESANVAYLDLSYENGGDTSDITEKNIKDKMVENGFPEDELNNYTITTSENNVIVSKAGDTVVSIEPADLVFEITTTTANQEVTMPFIPDEALKSAYLPSDYSGAYNNSFTLDYGDGTTIATISTPSNVITHTYVTPGKYTVTASGTCRSLFYDTSTVSNITPITKIVQWGDTKLLFVGLLNPNMSSIPSVTTDDELSDLIYFQLSNSANITAIPSGLFNNSSSLMRASFKSTSITSVPSGLFNNCINLRSILDIFRGCTSLTTIQSTMFDNCTALTNVESAFNGCSNLEGSVPEFWETSNFPNISGYTDCYSGLNSGNITNYSSIPESYK